jgi:hypothetical protein
MSFTDRLVLWLHIGFAIFALGPVTIAVLSTPRYIRGRNPVIVGYLLRTTRIYTLISLGVLVFGLVSAQQHKAFSKPWLTISMTLFVVALVLLVIIMRDQRRAVDALQLAAAQAAPAAAPGTAVRPAEGRPDRPDRPDEAEEAANDAEAARSAPDPEPGKAGTARPLGSEAHPVASVERGRIATMGGVVALLYLVILILMVWR